MKRLQIRAPKANEAVIVKQLAERFNGTMKSLASQGDTILYYFNQNKLRRHFFAGEQYKGADSFKDFEGFLYKTLQGIQDPSQQRPVSPSLRLKQIWSFLENHFCVFFYHFSFFTPVLKFLPQLASYILWIFQP